MHSTPRLAQATHYVSALLFPPPPSRPMPRRLRDDHPAPAVPAIAAEPAPIVLPFKITRATSAEDVARVLDVLGDVEAERGGRCEARLMRGPTGRVQAILFHYRRASRGPTPTASAAANVAQAVQWADDMARLDAVRALAPDVGPADDAAGEARAADLAHSFTEGA